jgi:hypothetical protein
MRTAFLILVLFLSAPGATGISSSRDSVLLHNSLPGSASDSFTLTNNTAGAVYLDSACAIFEDFDSSGIWPGGLQMHWVENHSTREFLWKMEKTGSAYTLKKDFFYPAGAVPLSISPGQSCDILRLEIGIYLVSNHYPIYPPYFRGTLRLFFNTGISIDILLRTADLRPNGYKIGRAHV